MSDFCKIHARRLSILADALEQDKHGHAEWDFGDVCRNYHCGTAGCAMGSLPYIFPAEWRMGVKYDEPFPELVGSKADDLHEDVNAFFGLRGNEVFSLFELKGYYPNLCQSQITPQIVAAKIRAFLEFKGRESQ